VLGLFLLAKGWEARRRITAALVLEHATTRTGGLEPVAGRESPSDDAGDSDSPHEEGIRDTRTALIRMEQIRDRTLGEMGPFQQLRSDVDRQFFLNGLSSEPRLVWPWWDMASRTSPLFSAARYYWPAPHF
jgi:hypothetical protein